MTKRLFILFPMLLSGYIYAQNSNSLLKELEEDAKDMGENFDTYVVNINKKFAAFVDSINNDYARFLEQTWNSTSFEGIRQQPKDDEVQPIRYDKKDEPKKDNIIQGNVIHIDTPKPQPTPIVPIEENQEIKAYRSFSFYGTTMKARWNDVHHFKFEAINKKNIAKAYRTFSQPQFKNLLHDCLELRKNYQLCDWAYYKMLESLAAAIYGKNSNEAVFLQGVLYAQSGYMIRFAIDPKTQKLHLLCKIVGHAFKHAYYLIDRHAFYIFDGTQPESLEFCPKEYLGEQPMSLDMPQLPKLTKELSEYRIIKTPDYSVEAKTRVNKNLINFFNDYPTSASEKDFMTRWAYYANAPVSKEVREELYPQLKKIIANMPPQMAARMLLKFVQPDGENPQSLQYGYDDNIWGDDRAFFAEETLYYPLSDCEDHAILFSHLVRDLLNLDVALVYYPKHLCTAIYFESDIKGDIVVVDNRKFVIADPTWENGPLGRLAPQFRNDEPSVILLNK